MAVTTSCPRCGEPCREGASACTQCGARLHPCPSCGGLVAEADRFCGSCGRAQDGHTSAAPEPSPWDEMLERLRKATLGEFQILREIGRGGMAAVYLAHDLALNRKVAIKVMSPGLLMGPGMVERFKQEAVTVANLNHPHIITIHAVRQVAGLQFFVMKLIAGRSLERVIEATGPLPVTTVQAILFQVGSALAYGHRRGVIHRDVKPGNILLDEEGNAIVTDFGIAKVRESPTQTMTGATVGTPAYMSPEQCWSRQVTGASDQYSLGIVAFEMLSGAPPFVGPTLGILRAHVEDFPPPLGTLRPDVPEPVAQAVARMLAKEPGDRFPDIIQAVTALGGRHLPEHDPLREELAELAVKDARPELSAARTPVSPIPVTAPRPAQPAPLTAVVVSTPSDRTIVGDSMQLQAVGQDAAGTSQPGRPLHWTSSNPSVATVSPSGVVTSHAPGSVTITASSDDGAYGVTLIEVAAAAPASAEVTGLPAELRVGDRASPGIAVRDARGGRLPTGMVRWSVSDAGVAQVSVSGALIAIGPGRVTLTASVDGGLTAMATITVLPPAVARVEILGAGRTWYPGGTARLATTVRDASGAELIGREVGWRSEDSRVAAVAPDGTVIANSAGVTGIIATSEGQSARVELRVAPAPVASLTIEPVGGPIRVGRRCRLRATAQDAGGAPLRDRSIRWASQHPEIADIDEVRGELRAVAPGIASVVATCDSIRAETTVEIAPAPPPLDLRRIGWIAAAATVAALVIWLAPWTWLRGGRGGGQSARVTLALDPVSATVRPGERVQLTPSFRAPDGELQPARRLTWRSSDTSVASIGGDGIVTARGVGTVIITATAGGLAAKAAIRVTGDDGPTSGGGDTSRSERDALVLTQPPARIAVGDTFTLAVTGGDPASAVRWRSNRPDVATVSTGGTITAMAEGPVTIVASRGADQAEIRLRVRGVPVGLVTVMPSALSLTVGDTSTFTAKVISASGDTLRGKLAVWESSNSAVAAVTSTGMVTAVGAGDATITATSGGVRGGATVTVAALRSGAASLEIAAPSSPLAVGDSVKLTAIARDADRRLLAAALRWRSGQPQVATIDPASGVIVARAPGVAVITASAEGASSTVRLTIVGGAGDRDRAGRGADTLSRPADEKTASTPPVGGAFRTLEAGGFTCAVGADGTTLCWGQGSRVPTPLGGPRFTALSAGLGFACGLTGGQQAFCWGANGKGQLGDGSTKSRPAPTLVSADLTFTTLSAGEAHACAITPGGNIYCWGNNGDGQLGDGSKGGRTRPTQIKENQNWKQVVAGGQHSCALTSGGQAYCWGDGFSGELGQGMMESSAEPVPVSGGHTFVALTAGRRHTCGITADFRAYCWGDNREGQLGNGGREDAAKPTRVARDVEFTSVSAGPSHTCGVTRAGRAMCWGANGSGQLGDGTQTARNAPVEVKTDAAFTSVSAGVTHTCGVTRDQGGVCWGGNNRGQLGDGTQVSRPIPGLVRAAPSR